MIESAEDVARKLEEAFRRRFAGGRYALGRTDYYGFEVTPEASDGRTFRLTIVFKKGERYCCAEQGCHLGLWRRRDWEALRREFSTVGLEGLGSVKIARVRVVVEKGARLGLRVPGDSAALQPEEGYSYEIGPFDEANPETVE